MESKKAYKLVAAMFKKAASWKDQLTDISDEQSGKTPMSKLPKIERPAIEQGPLGEEVPTEEMREEKNRFRSMHPDDTPYGLGGGITISEGTTPKTSCSDLNKPHRFTRFVQQYPNNPAHITGICGDCSNTVKDSFISPKGDVWLNRARNFFGNNTDAYEEYLKNNNIPLEVRNQDIYHK
jgi:hypothetical protein